MSRWQDYIENKQIIQALVSNNFISPTPIQQKSLKFALKRSKDIIIAAQTGSGKTLCFAIPLVVNISRVYSPQALIIVPTRELVIQIKQHISSINVNELSIATIIGGMSRQKQERVLRQTQPEIIIATPGRLWELINEVQNDYITEIYKIKYLIIDEADRMIEIGHFKELNYILNYIYNPMPDYKQTTSESTVQDLNFGFELQLDSQNFYTKGEIFKDLFKKGKPKLEEVKEPEIQQNQIQRQTFLVSATLTMEEDGRLTKKAQKKLKRKGKTDNRIDSLLGKLKFNGDPQIIDLTPQNKLPEQLKEFRINCKDDEKDSFLYTVLKKLQYNSAIVFTNSISSTKRLTQLLKQLDIRAVRLDGRMRQNQRLKKLDQFKQGIKILISTEVTGRGIDLPMVDLVIHYQFPFTAEQYVHRCGRTARMGKQGQSISIVSPKDLQNCQKVLQVLQRQPLPLKLDLSQRKEEIRAVQLASDIISEENRIQRQSRQSRWEQEGEEASGIIQKKVKRVKSRENYALKQQLQSLVQRQHQGPRSSVITPEMFKKARENKMI